MATFNYIADMTQLSKELENILTRVLNAVSDALLKDFQQHLDSTVYAAPVGDYERYYDKGGFYSGWYINYMEKYVQALAFNGNRLVAPSADMKNSQMAHGGNNGGDQRGKMPWILNDIQANDEYSYNGGANYLYGNQGYWDSYLKDIDKKIEKWFDDEFKKYGISRR